MWKFLAKFKNLIFLNFQLWLCLVLTWDLLWITRMGNHGAAGVISEPRCYSYSSYFYSTEINHIHQRAIWKDWKLLVVITISSHELLNSHLMPNVGGIVKALTIMLYNVILREIFCGLHHWLIRRHDLIHVNINDLIFYQAGAFATDILGPFQGQIGIIYWYP